MSEKPEPGMYVLRTVLLLVALLRHGASSDTLFSSTSDVVSVAGDVQFRSTVFESSAVWLVEFYQSSCGHCRQYAPAYSAHAGDVKAWSSVARVAAINCADELNLPLCRDLKVNSVPDIRMFPALQRNVAPDGKLFQGIDLQSAANPAGGRSAAVLRHHTIDLIRQQKTRPKSWNGFSLEREKDFKPSFDAALKFAIVFEKPSSYLGDTLKLDMLLCPGVKVHIVCDKKLVNQHSVHALPSVLAWNGEQKNLVSNCSRDSCRDLLLSLCGKVHHGGEKSLGKEDIKPLRSPPAPGVFMSDLVSALAFAIHREVALQPVIHGPALQALTHFLQAVHYCMPAPPEVRQYVVGLLRQLKMSRSSQPLSSVTWARMKTRQTSTSRLPHTVHWVGCAGSSPGLRGYPCGLWTLFHTMTAQCALVGDGEPVEDLASDRRTLMRRRVAGVNGRWALLAIRDYIDHFFGCADCRSHFLSMSKHLESEVVANHDAVLWLWRKHNAVNRRLASASTADPVYPKVQFPLVSLCPECHVLKSPNGGGAPADREPDSDSDWNADAVLAFLYRYYGPDGIRWSDDAKTWSHDSVQHKDSMVEGHYFHPPAVVPHAVYYVLLCMLAWVAIMVYLRPMTWCRRLHRFKGKEHMV